MIAKFVFFALCGAALAQGGVLQSSTDSDALKNLMEAGNKRVLETRENVRKAQTQLKEAAGERLECLLGEHKVQKIATNNTISEAVFKGMQNNRWFVNYQCIVDCSQDTFQKLDAIESQIAAPSKNIVEKGLAGIRALDTLVPGINGYLQDFHKVKLDQMNKAKNDDERKKILKEAEEKIKYMSSISQQINDLVKEIKFKALEEYINFAFQTETNLKKVQKEGAQKILKCAG